MAKIKPIPLQQSSRNIGAKFYKEQLPYGEETLINAIKTTSSSTRRVAAIKHTDDSEKDQWHFMLEAADGSNFNVAGELHRFGIYFRPGIDDTLMKERGLETLGGFDSYLEYMLHTDEESIAAGKKQYSLDQIVSNLPKEELQNILDGKPQKKKKLSSAEQAEIAWKAGYDAKGFHTVSNMVGISGLSSSADKKLRKKYEDGAEQRMKEHLMVDRLSIEIQTQTGDKDITDDKVISTLQRMFKGIEIVVYKVTNGSLHFDPTTDAIISTTYNRVLSSEYINTVAEEGSNKKTVWSGQYYIYLNNAPKGEKKSDNCFVCRIENKKLVCISSAHITGEERSHVIAEMYKEFRDKFNTALEEKENTKAYSFNLDYLNS